MSCFIKYATILNGLHNNEIIMQNIYKTYNFEIYIFCVFLYDNQYSVYVRHWRYRLYKLPPPPWPRCAIVLSHVAVGIYGIPFKEVRAAWIFSLSIASHFDINATRYRNSHSNQLPYAAILFTYISGVRYIRATQKKI